MTTTPAEVLADHTAGLQTSDGVRDDQCSLDGFNWPCDAVQMARQLQEAQERVARLEAVLRLHNQTSTGKTRQCLPGCIACALLAPE
jgi:hypothetical protein